MVSIGHLAALVDHAARNGCKLVLAGDQEQLAAVEGGGAMMLLADRLGYVQLAEPVRFTAAWERDASLRLRRGDPTALDDYDQHGRIHGAPPDEAMDQAAKAYVASYLAGPGCDPHRRRLEPLPGTVAADPRRPDPPRPSRRHPLGEDRRGRRSVRGRPGHLPRATTTRSQAGEPGRGLANGDVLRIEAITPAGIQVRRLLDPDPATGQRRFTERAFHYTGYSHL